MSKFIIHWRLKLEAVAAILLNRNYLLLDCRGNSEFKEIIREREREKWIEKMPEVIYLINGPLALFNKEAV